eukprot:m51a1_g3464 hypothetical protein (388) ;mRNA; r:733082-734660
MLPLRESAPICKAKLSFSDKKERTPAVTAEYDSANSAWLMHVTDDIADQFFGDATGRNMTVSMSCTDPKDGRTTSVSWDGFRLGTCNDSAVDECIDSSTTNKVCAQCGRTCVRFPMEAYPVVQLKVLEKKDAPVDASTPFQLLQTISDDCIKQNVDPNAAMDSLPAVPHCGDGVVSTELNEDCDSTDYCYITTCQCVADSGPVNGKCVVTPWYVGFRLSGGITKLDDKTVKEISDSLAGQCFDYEEVKMVNVERSTTDPIFRFGLVPVEHPRPISRTPYLVMKQARSDKFSCIKKVMDSFGATFRCYDSGDVDYIPGFQPGPTPSSKHEDPSSSPHSSQSPRSSSKNDPSKPDVPSSHGPVSPTDSSFSNGAALAPLAAMAIVPLFL